MTRCENIGGDVTVSNTPTGWPIHLLIHGIGQPFFMSGEVACASISAFAPLASDWLFAARVALVLAPVSGIGKPNVPMIRGRC